MALKENIDEAIKQAMKNKEQERLQALRSIKSAILLAEREENIEKGIDEQQEIQILQKLAKQRKGSIQSYEDKGRDDLIQTEKQELAVIEEFLPEQMSEEEIRNEVKMLIEETGAASVKEMGKVMGAATKKLAGKADNQTISRIAKEMLS